MNVLRLPSMGAGSFDCIGAMGRTEASAAGEALFVRTGERIGVGVLRFERRSPGPEPESIPS